MPITDRTGFSMPVRLVPGQDDSRSAPSGSWLIRSVRPLYPPTLCSPTRVSASSAATIT